MSTLTIATQNIGKANNVDLAAEVDAFCGQEGGDQKAVVRKAAAKHNLTAFQPVEDAGQGQVPILLRPGQVLGGMESHLAVGSRWVGKGAGPDHVHNKFINHVNIDIEGVEGGFHVLDTHMVASASRSKQYLGTKAWTARRDHFHDHIDAILSLVSTLDGYVTLQFDSNGNPDFELLAPLHKAGFKGWTTVPTHGKNIYDHSLYLPAKGLRRLTTRTVDVGSDHLAVVAKYGIKVAA